MQRGQLKPCVVLTRAKSLLGDSEVLCQHKGFLPYHMPIQLSEILSKQESRPPHLDDYTDLVFVSPTAVDMATQQLSLCIPPKRIYGMGESTVTALSRKGLKGLAPENGVGAEALLQRDDLQEMTLRRVLWIRGEEGLDWPLERLRQRGAKVDAYVCYRRRRHPQLDERLTELFVQKRHDLRAILIHSLGDASALLLALSDAEQALQQSTRIICASERIADRFLQVISAKQIELANSPSNEDMLAAV